MDTYRWSLYNISGHWLWVLALQSLAGLAALALMLGYRARMAALISLVMLISLHNRVPLVLQGGDNLLLLMLFWMCFLPIGHRYSIDQALVDPRLPAAKPVPSAYWSVASVAILLPGHGGLFFLSLSQKW